MSCAPTPAPATPPGRQPVPRRDNGFRYRPRFGVIVICEGEAHQRAVYSELLAAGHACRVVTV